MGAKWLHKFLVSRETRCTLNPLRPPSGLLCPVAVGAVGSVGSRRCPFWLRCSCLEDVFCPQDGSHTLRLGMFRLLDRVTLFTIARYTGLRRFAIVATASNDPSIVLLARACRLIYGNQKLARVLLRLARETLRDSFLHLELQVSMIALAEALRPPA